ncbi:MAG: hypothetical protein SH809_11005 [Rhodothermales bacterium]|nr:hypothetical protein [Rhodothermales bacterium]
MRAIRRMVWAIVASTGLVIVTVVWGQLGLLLGFEEPKWLMAIEAIFTIILMGGALSLLIDVSLASDERILHSLGKETEMYDSLIQTYRDAGDKRAELLKEQTNAEILDAVFAMRFALLEAVRDGFDKAMDKKEVKKRIQEVAEERAEQLVKKTLDDIGKKFMR